MPANRYNLRDRRLAPQGNIANWERTSRCLISRQDHDHDDRGCNYQPIHPPSFRWLVIVTLHRRSHSLTLRITVTPSRDCVQYQEIQNFNKKGWVVTQPFLVSTRLFQGYIGLQAVSWPLLSVCLSKQTPSAGLLRIAQKSLAGFSRWETFTKPDITIADFSIHSTTQWSSSSVATA